MDKEELQKRTRLFALETIRLVDLLPPSRVSEVIGRQLLRAATSVGANYRAACHARSTADFISKIGIVEEEADESTYWLELILEAGLLKPEQSQPLMKEARELTAIFTATGKTAKQNHPKKSGLRPSKS
jgi:four helix bundle protein